MATVQEIEAELAEVTEGLKGSGGNSPFAKADAYILVALRLVKDGVDPETVKQGVQSAWERYVVPYNVPWVPEFIERRIEARALAAILEAIDEAAK